jgi:DNA-binding XRE family transcriptional regulator
MAHPLLVNNNFAKLVLPLTIAGDFVVSMICDKKVVLSLTRHNRMSDFGEKVRGYRKELGITQKALAEAAGITPTYFNRMEKGNRKIPRVETVLALVTA